MEWTTACPDWADRIKERRSLITCQPLFPDYAEYALDIFKSLKIVDVIGQPTIGEISRPWLLDFAGAIFGSLNDIENKRYIREFFLLISKKNTKSTSAAEIMLTLLILNVRDSAELLILAPTKEVADNAFFPARDTIRVDAELSAIFHVQDHLRMITHRKTGAYLKVVAAENETVSGKKASVVLIDELWLFGKKHNAENMIREATGGLASRPEGCVIYLSTQSDEPPSGVFKSKLQYARGVRDGRIDDNQFLPVIYEYPQDMLDVEAHRDSSTFYIPNPNIGASVSQEFLEREFKKADEDGLESLRGFYSKHLNVEIGIALQSNRWAGADYWQATADPALTLDAIIERCEVIDIGVDGGGLDDLLGMCVLGREIDTGNWLAWHKGWAHPSVLERRKSEAARFHDFSKVGDLTLVKRIGDDVREVADIIERVRDADLLDKIGVDPAGIGSILDELESREIRDDQIIGIPQGWKLGGAIKTAERRLAEGTMLHCDQPMMAWCAGNARIEPRANGILITKQASGFAKIDPLIALFNAVTLLSLNPTAMTARYQAFVM